MDEWTTREQELLMKAVDGLLSDDEKKELAGLKQKNPGLEAELQSLQSLKEATMEMKLRNAPEETWDRYWAGVYARMERGLAWLLISIGAALLSGFAMYSWTTTVLGDANTPMFLRIAIGALSVGFAILLVSVVREKIFTRKSDKYREVVR
jgi:hypothetical protein